MNMANSLGGAEWVGPTARVVGAATSLWVGLWVGLMARGGAVGVNT